MKARDHFPGGILIDNAPWDFTGALAKTNQLIKSGKTDTIYEAAFEYMGCYARADIIQYQHTTNRWRIYEVKSTTKVKPEHLDDISLQAWIMAKSGLPIEQINMLHLNSHCRYPDLSNLFNEVDVTDEVRSKYLSVKPKIAEIYTALRNPDTEKIDIGPYCLAPTECGFVDHCWSEKAIPKVSVFDLPGMRDRKWALYHEGIIQLDDDHLTDLTDLQQRIIDCYHSNTRYINREGIQSAIANWVFPLTFLDFETINPAIPRYQGCGSYHHVPFQFSVHQWADNHSDLHHIEFLHDNASDPRITLIPALLDACGSTG